MTSKNYKNKQKISALFQATIVLLVIMTAFGFSFRYFSTDDTTSRVVELERSLNEMRSALNSDSIREYNIQKVMAISDRYNPDMSSEKKYEIASEIYRMSLKYDNLNVDLIAATITHESALSWDPLVNSYVGAMGLMQVMPATGMYVARYEDISWTSADDILHNPIYNIRIGCRYLSSLIELFENDIDAGLAAYNGGQRQAALWVASGKSEGVLWAETEHYVPAIRKLYTEYQSLNII